MLRDGSREKVARQPLACASQRGSPRLQDERAHARARVPPRSDVAAAAGRITLLALCWYPFETGLRREALEVPAVVNVGSAHSRCRLSHEGGKGKEARSATQALKGGGV